MEIPSPKQQGNIENAQGIIDPRMTFILEGFQQGRSPAIMDHHSSS
jgi:hypothetical protein